MAIMIVGVALIALGFIGTILGNLIKAAVSRQRERLADASGVQFTRNPSGLAGALKRIGALEFGSRLQSPNAVEASHLYFAEGVWSGFARLWATHPPLPDRIRELAGTSGRASSAAKIRVYGAPQLRYASLARLADRCAVVFSAVAYAGNEEADAQRAFHAAANCVPELKIALQPREMSDLGALQQRSGTYSVLRRTLRGRVIQACAAAISADGRTTLQEAELLRGIADLLGCSMPPLLSGEVTRKNGEVTSTSQIGVA